MGGTLRGDRRRVQIWLVMNWVAMLTAHYRSGLYRELCLSVVIRSITAECEFPWLLISFALVLIHSQSLHRYNISSRYPQCR